MEREVELRMAKPIWVKCSKGCFGTDIGCETCLRLCVCLSVLCVGVSGSDWTSCDYFIFCLVLKLRWS